MNEELFNVDDSKPRLTKRVTALSTLSQSSYDKILHAEHFIANQLKQWFYSQ